VRQDPRGLLLIIRSVEMHGAGVSFYPATVREMQAIGKLRH
jgi:hypothetical protein